MYGKKQFRNLLLNIISRVATAALTIAVAFALTVVLNPSGQAQTYSTIYNFTRGQDGGWPESGMSLAIDRAGNLYGTNYGGGYTGGDCAPAGCGAAFELMHTSSGWVLVPLYDFQGGEDRNAFASLTIGGDGTLYGTTSRTVFRLSPALTPCRKQPCAWVESVLYDFTNGSGGQGPFWSPVIFDAEGDMYLTTEYGGQYGYGAVVELTPSGDHWIQNVLYSFAWGDDGALPESGVVFDQAGNLYGVTTYGGGYRGRWLDCGTVFQLKPSSAGWTENVLHRFQCGSDGGYPVGGLTFDQSGNLYGTTPFGGSGSVGAVGTVFMLTPSGGDWNFTVLHRFFDSKDAWPENPWPGPQSKLAIDAADSLYGTTTGSGAGTVFKLTPSGGDWTYSLLHEFTGSGDDGYRPCGVTLDPSGNLYGTTNGGGAYGDGVIFEITP